MADFYKWDFPELIVLYEEGKRPKEAGQLQGSEKASDRQRTKGAPVIIVTFRDVGIP